MSSFRLLAALVVRPEKLARVFVFGSGPSAHDINLAYRIWKSCSSSNLTFHWFA